MFKEYPKSLHLDGDWNAKHVVVHNAEEEAAKRAKGFRMLNEPQKENELQKRTRKAKQ